MSEAARLEPGYSDVAGPMDVCSQLCGGTGKRGAGGCDNFVATQGTTTTTTLSSRSGWSHTGSMLDGLGSRASPTTYDFTPTEIVKI